MTTSQLEVALGKTVELGLHNGLTLDEIADVARRAALCKLLEQCQGNVCEAARRSGKHRNSLERWMKIYGITAWAYKPGGFKQWEKRYGNRKKPPTVATCVRQRPDARFKQAQ